MNGNNIDVAIIANNGIGKVVPSPDDEWTDNEWNGDNYPTIMDHHDNNETIPFWWWSRIN